MSTTINNEIRRSTLEVAPEDPNQGIILDGQGEQVAVPVAHLSFSEAAFNPGAFASRLVLLSEDVRNAYNRCFFDDFAKNPLDNVERVQLRELMDKFSEAIDPAIPATVNHVFTQNLNYLNANIDFAEVPLMSLQGPSALTRPQYVKTLEIY